MSLCDPSSVQFQYASTIVANAPDNTLEPNKVDVREVELAIKSLGIQHTIITHASPTRINKGIQIAIQAIL